MRNRKQTRRTNRRVKRDEGLFAGVLNRPTPAFPLVGRPRPKRRSVDAPYSTIDASNGESKKPEANSKQIGSPQSNPTRSNSTEPQSAEPRTIEAVIQAKIESAQQKKAAAASVEQSSYQSETRRPLVCLAFVFPLIMAYEIGTMMLGRAGLRSGVDQWLDQLLSSLGFGQLILLPLITTAIMMAWHHRIDDHWRVRWPVLTGMALEALGLGLILFWIANAVHLSSHSSLVTAIPATIEAHSIGIASTDNGTMIVAPAARLATLMAFIGSGIYEEVFFRLILLLPAIAWATRLTNPKMGTVLGMLVVSVVFATLHYDIINPAGAEFELSSFFFRFTASIVFCVLFLFRGFGIAVGAHVAFDALTQL
jgi:hypothetical protein